MKGFKCLPGRLAVLVPDYEPAGIVLPDAVRLRYLDLERPPVGCVRGEVVAVGFQRGRAPMPMLGQFVWVKPKPGLIIEPGDIDLPGLGASVPKGFTLRLYGVGDPWDECVMAVEE